MNTLYVIYIVNEMMIYDTFHYIVLVDTDLLVDKVSPIFQTSSLHPPNSQDLRQKIPFHLFSNSSSSQQIRFYSSQLSRSRNVADLSLETGLNPPNYLRSEYPRLQLRPQKELARHFALWASSPDLRDSTADTPGTLVEENQQPRWIIRRTHVKGPLGRPQSDPVSIAYNNKLAKLADPETPKVVKITPTVPKLSKSPRTGHSTLTFHKKSMLVLEAEDPIVKESKTQDPTWVDIYLTKIKELKAAKLAYKTYIREKVLNQQASSWHDVNTLEQQLTQNVIEVYAAAELARKQAKQQKPMSADIAKKLETQPLLPLQPLSRVEQSVLEEGKEAAQRSISKQFTNGEEIDQSESIMKRKSILLARKSRKSIGVSASNLEGVRYPIGEDNSVDRDDSVGKVERLLLKTARTRRSNLPYRKLSGSDEGSAPKLSDAKAPVVEKMEVTSQNASIKREKLLAFETAPTMLRKSDSTAAHPDKPKKTYVKLNDPYAIIPQPLDKRWTVVNRELLTAGTGLLWKHFPEHFGPNGEQLKPFYPIIERSLHLTPHSKYRIVETLNVSRNSSSTKQKPIRKEQENLDRSTKKNIPPETIIDVLTKPEIIGPKSSNMKGSPLTTAKRPSLTVESAPAISSRSFSTSAAVAKPKLTHLTPSGSAHMVDIAAKEVTSRTAIAKCNIDFSNTDVLPLIKANQMKKGDVLGVARIAGIMAAKKTSDLIPLCHPIAITNATVELEIREPKPAEDAAEYGFGSIEITASVSCDGKTGVEMEALTACSAAALTVYDMCKAVDKGMRIENLRVVRKSGGRSGDFIEEEPKE